MSGKHKRKHDECFIISDDDDVVNDMITRMYEVAEEDRILNAYSIPTTQKLTLLPTVVMHLKQQDLKEKFIDSGVMSAITEWLSPLPDCSLPSLKIREELLKILQELPNVSQEILKDSGIVSAVTCLRKHPRESGLNKDIAGKLLNEWSQSIFGTTSDFKGMASEERGQTDLKRRRDEGPDDPGFCARARVPLPSSTYYAIRPKWNIDLKSSQYQGNTKIRVSRLEKKRIKLSDIKKKSRSMHAVKLSIDGSDLPL